MKAFDKLSNINKTLVGLTITLLVYGYLCRPIDVYFFWESKTIGWILLLITIISILVQRIKTKKPASKKATAEKIFIGLTSFILLMQTILFFVIPQTAAYTVAKHYLMSDKTLSNEIGEVYNVFLVPVGGMAMSSDSAGQSGEADLNFIVKGKDKFKDINLHLIKESNTNWTLIP